MSKVQDHCHVGYVVRQTSFGAIEGWLMMVIKGREAELEAARMKVLRQKSGVTKIED